MTTTEIAHRVAALCRAGDFETAQQELFATDALSIEQYPGPDFENETRELDSIIKKNKRFDEMLDKLYDIEVAEPVIAGNAFAFTISMDMAMKGQQRSIMSELCVYLVNDGKIISESFFM